MMHLLSPQAIVKAQPRRLQKIFRSAGFYRQKTEAIRNFSAYLMRHYDGDLNRFFNRDLLEIRNELLSLKGIGEETADSILLYAGGKMTFVVDAYTTRILNRIDVTQSKSYLRVKNFIEENLPKDLEIYQEFHALLVALGKTFCKTRPLCNSCPVIAVCHFGRSRSTSRM